MTMHPASYGAPLTTVSAQPKIGSISPNMLMHHQTTPVVSSVAPSMHSAHLVTGMPQVTTMQQYGRAPATVHSVQQAPVMHQSHQAMNSRHNNNINLLANGVVVSEGVVARDDLMAQGRLIPDLKAEEDLLRQTSQIPGAMAGPHSAMMHHHAEHQLVMPAQHPGAHIVQHNQQTMVAQHEGAVYHDAHAMMQPVQHDVVQHDAHAMMQHEAPVPEALEVSILQANNLVSLNRFTGDQMWVTCEVIHRTGHVVAHGHVPTAQSSIADKSISPDPLNPIWNECHVLDGFFPGDSLQFTIHDHGLMGSKTEGAAHIDTEHFYHADGWEGELAIEGLQHATLSVRIRPLGPLDHQAVESQEAHYAEQHQQMLHHHQP